MAIKGSLREAGLADVCQLLALGRKGGCLSVADGSRFGQIFFDRGRITYARIVNRRDRLGDILVRDGALTQAQLDEVLQWQAREPDRRLGELLVRSGYISEAQLTRFIRLQIEEAVYHLFTWSRGNFFFEVDARPEDADIIASINPEALLLEAARRVDEWSLIERKIPAFDVLIEADRERLEQSRMTLTAEQERLVPIADGTRTVHDLVDQSGMTEFEVGKALFGLIQAGLARRVGQRADGGEQVREVEKQERRNLGEAFYRTGMLEDAGREFHRVVELAPTDFAARYHLALIALREGRGRDAARLLQALLEEKGYHYGAFMNLALALRLLGRHENALLVLETAESLRPAEPAVHLARAMTLLEAGEHASAGTAFDGYRARLQADRRPAPAYFYGMALHQAMCCDLAAAAATIASGLGLYPDSAPLLLMSGLLSERRGDLDNADRAYRRVVEEDSTLPQGHRNLGDVAYRRGSHHEALQHYMNALELAPELGDDVHARIGNLLYKLRRVDEAVQFWRKALELNPDNAIVRSNLEIVADAAG
jgi:tetratricopeptide (TPR) repeat protein